MVLKLHRGSSQLSDFRKMRCKHPDRVRMVSKAKCQDLFVFGMILLAGTEDSHCPSSSSVSLAFIPNQAELKTLCNIRGLWLACGWLKPIPPGSGCSGCKGVISALARKRRRVKKGVDNFGEIDRGERGSSASLGVSLPLASVARVDCRSDLPRSLPRPSYHR